MKTHTIRLSVTVKVNMEDWGKPTDAIDIARARVNTALTETMTDPYSSVRYAEHTATGEHKFTRETPIHYTR